jgi:hypothetical protein
MLRSYVGCASVVLAIVAGVLMVAPSWTPSGEEGWTLDTHEHVVEGHVTGEPVQVLFRLTNRSAGPLRIVGATCC